MSLLSLLPETQKAPYGSPQHAATWWQRLAFSVQVDRSESLTCTMRFGSTAKVLAKYWQSTGKVHG